jgi:hypothetical protein
MREGAPPRSGFPRCVLTPFGVCPRPSSSPFGLPATSNPRASPLHRPCIWGGARPSRFTPGFGPPSLEPLTNPSLRSAPAARRLPGKPSPRRPAPPPPSRPARQPTGRPRRPLPGRPARRRTRMERARRLCPLRPRRAARRAGPPAARRWATPRPRPRRLRGRRRAGGVQRGRRDGDGPEEGGVDGPEEGLRDGDCPEEGRRDEDGPEEGRRDEVGPVEGRRDNHARRGRGPMLMLMLVDMGWAGSPYFLRPPPPLPRPLLRPPPPLPCLCGYPPTRARRGPARHPPTLRSSRPR